VTFFLITWLSIIAVKNGPGLLRLVNEQLLHRLEQLLKLSFGSKSERYLGKDMLFGNLFKAGFT